MKVNDYLNELRKIKDVAMATVDSDGYPQIRIIDVMAVENNNLYFLTARGKNFYQELLDKNFVSLVALTKDYGSIRLKGKVKKVSNQKEWLEKIFIDNPSMNEVYPGDSRNILEVFCIFDGEIEIFDLSKVPIERSQYDLCDNRIFNKGYLISNRCIACDRCKRECPQQCIKSGSKYKIMQDHCLHCGLCYENCPVRAIEKVG